MRHARMSGINSADLAHTPLRAKIAGLLPLPAFLKQKLAGSAQPSSPDVSAFALWSQQASSVDPGVLSSWGKAAATAATIAIAGVSAGAATQPSSEASAAADARSLIERLTSGDSSAGAGGVAAAPAAPAAAQSGAAQASGRGRAVERSGSSSSSGRERESGGGSAGSKSGSASKDTETRGTTTPSTALPVAGGAAPSTDSTDDGSSALGDTLERLTGGGSSDGSGGEAKGEETPDEPANLLPGPSAPQTEVPAGTPQVPVQDVVGGTGKSVDETVDEVTEATQGLLGGQ
jgi:hypothetical protein